MTSADALNHNCYCRTFNPRRQPGHPADEGKPEGTDVEVPDRLLADLILDRPLLFSSTAVFITEHTRQAILGLVTAIDRVVALPAYQAQAGLMALRLSGSLSYPLAPDTRLLVFGRIDSVQGAANQASPLVRQNTGLSGGLVLVYTWKQSEVRATD